MSNRTVNNSNGGRWKCRCSRIVSPPGNASHDVDYLRVHIDCIRDAFRARARFLFNNRHLLPPEQGQAIAGEIGEYMREFEPFSTQFFYLLKCFEIWFDVVDARLMHAPRHEMEARFRGPIDELEAKLDDCEIADSSSSDAFPGDTDQSATEDEIVAD